MTFQDLIRKKRDGYELSREEIQLIVEAIADGAVPDYQISAWAMAVYFRGMTDQETRDLAIAMAHSGDVVNLSAIEGIKVDKHSTGGVGDKTTMIVLPLVAAAGVPVAKMSGRGLGHTGGTIDKFEAIPGFKVEKSHPDFIAQVNQVKAAVVSQTGNLVPADKKLYAIRDITATVDSIPLIASSVMSKKIAAGAEGIVLDVKVGRGAFMTELSLAEKLARTMVEIGSGAGRKVVAVLSNMDQPLGRMVGNALEVKEALDTLRGQGPWDLTELSLHLAAYMVVLGGRCSNYQTARSLVEKLLSSGAGFKKFQEMVAAQQGRLDYESKDYGLPGAALQLEVFSSQAGYIAEVDAFQVGATVMGLGAGREYLEDEIDHTVGIELLKKIGDSVEKGEVLAVIHANQSDQAEEARRDVLAAYGFSHKPVDKPGIIFKSIE